MCVENKINQNAQTEFFVLVQKGAFFDALDLPKFKAYHQFCRLACEK
jgi:hypothetical protein